MCIRDRLLTVQKSSVASTSGACRNLYDTMERLEEKYEGLHLTALRDQGQYIDPVSYTHLDVYKRPKTYCHW